ncbi:ABC transporter substrate-binding protein [Chitinimonas taiwanensis]|jgi:arginine/ornithine transport system substrate-binding protein|uniref:Arginine/ornithine transport system substrate-binding protein n=1 Tax=Chitinimonas taiwanensis DSM 18899 TaxID=1121279 RepID=A0A1K2H6V1_9NEIS|nr:ABC transporter substrate-binding protein [Chitinimonas taiwanensis]SFZ71998.1 arginine/ornithine transport system substrate-binding protein [Chitinimonas taiwanensis DSM 18899]
MKKTALFGAIALALSVAASAKEWKEIRVGIDATYKPFTYKTPDGKPTGFDVDIANALCAELKAKCVFVEQAWDGMIPGLNAKKYDAIVSSMSITEERKRAVDFTGKYYNTPSRIVVKLGGAIKNVPADLKGKKIGVLKGSTQEKYAKGELEGAGAVVVPYEAQDQVYLDIKSGRLDGTVADSVEVYEGFLKTADGKGWGFVGPVLNEPKYFGEGAGIAVRKSDQDLKAALNKAIGTIRANGTWKKINDKYFNFEVWGK